MIHPYYTAIKNDHYTNLQKHAKNIYREVKNMKKIYVYIRTVRKWARGTAVTLTGW